MQQDIIIILLNYEGGSEGLDLLRVRQVTGSQNYMEHTQFVDVSEVNYGKGRQYSVYTVYKSH